MDIKCILGIHEYEVDFIANEKDSSYIYVMYQCKRCEKKTAFRIGPCSKMKIETEWLEQYRPKDDIKNKIDKAVDDTLSRR